MAVGLVMIVLVLIIGWLCPGRWEFPVAAFGMSGVVPCFTSLIVLAWRWLP